MDKNANSTNRNILMNGIKNENSKIGINISGNSSNNAFPTKKYNEVKRLNSRRYFGKKNN